MIHLGIHVGLNYNQILVIKDKIEDIRYMELDRLVSSFQKGDIKAFEKLYEMYSDSMLGVIHNILRDRVLAEDTLQDVFVKMSKINITWLVKACAILGRFTFSESVDSATIVLF